MQEDLIYKLKALQSIEPEEGWKAEKRKQLAEKAASFGVKNGIFLSTRDVYAKKERMSLRYMIPNGMAVALTSLVLLFSGGQVMMAASQSSLPGDSLYGVKKAGEQVRLALASDQERPKIEIEQAGKRLEELAAVSQKTSDASQHEKVQRLVEEFKDKVASANEHLTALSGQEDKTKLASAAKVVTEQSDKYADVLQKTTDNLPTTVKNRVATELADAAKTNETVSFRALAVLVENKGMADSQEVTAIVQKALEKAEAKLTSATNTIQTQSAPAGATENQICAQVGETQKTPEVKDAQGANVSITAGTAKALEDAKQNLTDAKANMTNNNLVDTVKSVTQVVEMAEKAVADPTVITTLPTTTVPADVSEVQSQSAPQTSGQ